MQGIRVIDNVIEVEVNVSAAAHAAGDVVCQPVELPLITNSNGCAVVESVVIRDYDNTQGITLYAVFLKSPIAIGVNNAAMTISDNDLDQVLGHVAVSNANYISFTNNQIGTQPNCGLELRADPSRQNSVWLALRSGGTPTYGSGKLGIVVGVLRG